MVIFNQALDPLYSRSGMLSSEAHLEGLTNWKAGKRRDKAKSELPVLKTGSPNVILLSITPATGQMGPYVLTCENG